MSNRRRLSGDARDPIRVVLCDDHRLVAQALSIVIELESDLEMACPPVECGEEAVVACSAHRPDVVLMDTALAGAIDAIEAARRIKETCRPTQVLMMATALPEPALLVRAAEAGAVGFVDKKGDVAKFREAVQAAARGEMLIDPAALAWSLQQAAREREARRYLDEALHRLTAREREVLELLQHGLGRDDIAGELHISRATARTHIQNILCKLGVHSKLEAVTFAVRAGDSPAYAGRHLERIP